MSPFKSLECVSNLDIFILQYIFVHFSPLTGVDLEDVGMFLVQLTNRDFLQSKPENIDELGSDFVFQIFFLNSLRFFCMREADKKMARAKK